jgi:2-polyprenyl-6-methoxyphenol hydroxylase-like FAD-dependent oxidoreductase
MQIPAQCDVLVVGAGPTGLMLANQLARFGVNTIIVDRHAGPARETRALGVQARTVEIYSHLGIAERALELGKRATGAHLWVQGHHRARIPLGDIGRELSPYPFVLILGQDDNERLLGDVLRSRGVNVHWNTELVGLQQHTDHATARLRTADGAAHEIRARWIAGCDGAHSAVRRLNGIDFPGAAYEQIFFVADTTATGPMAPAELNVYLWDDGFHLFFPMRGTDHWRVVGIVPPELRARTDLTIADMEPSIRRHVGEALTLAECRWFSIYRIHHRRAERFAAGRCFLLGDAAHIHSPVGAQGMNTGLQDAYNLAWKLALVSAGRADEALLTSYQTERLPVAQRLLATTDRAFSVIVSNRWFSRLLRTKVLARVMAFAMRFARTQRLAFRTISQIGIHYRASPLSETLPGLPAGTPRAGDRFPWARLKFASDTAAEDIYQRLDDTRFNLILVGQGILTADLSQFSTLLRVHEVAVDPDNDAELMRVGVRKPSFFLVRPDGHIGFAGTRLNVAVLLQYLITRIKLR